MREWRRPLYKEEWRSDEQIDRDTHDHDLTYENEQSTVTIPLKEYDKLKDQNKYITDPTLIGMIDKMEFFLKELRKHIVRKL
jgi:hypothetical protein